MTLLKKISVACFPYPFLFAIYPILALWKTNYFQIDSSEVLKPFILSLFFSGLLFLVLRMALRSWNKAALFSGLFIFLFFAFGHVLNLLSQHLLLGVTSSKPRNLIILWAVIFLAAGYLILRYGQKTDSFNQLLNFTGFALILIVSIQIGYSAFQANAIVKAYQNGASLPDAQTQPVQLVSQADSPDVYFIILDGYMRDDRLATSFNFDNSPFLQQLKELGFVLPSCAQSNYTSTALSLSSELNMNYLPALGIDIIPSPDGLDYDLLSKYIQHSLVRDAFYRAGYKMVSFETGFRFLNISDANVYIQENSNLWQNFTTTTDFDEMLSSSTLFALNTYLQQKFPRLAGSILKLQNQLQSLIPKNLVKPRSSYQQRYDLIMNELAKIQSVPSIPGKKFVYLHVVAPHVAANDHFILGADGSFKLTTNESIGYVDAVKYLNSRMIPILKGIIEQSKIPPVIILQGDHGWKNSPNTRTTILNAYYLPSGGDKLIYPSITPVNTFRTIFDYYFGAHFENLENTSYFAPDNNISALTRVPVVCPR
jgi:hypothetical protein